MSHLIFTWTLREEHYPINWSIQVQLPDQHMDNGCITRFAPVILISKYSKIWCILNINFEVFLWGFEFLRTNSPPPSLSLPPSSPLSPILPPFLPPPQSLGYFLGKIKHVGEGGGKYASSMYIWHCQLYVEIVWRVIPGLPRHVLSPSIPWFSLCLQPSWWELHQQSHGPNPKDILSKHHFQSI